MIDLTGPDGTTVRLADHPGGPDNSGNDFAGTIFDDEAARGSATWAPPRPTPAASSRRTTSSRASTARAAAARGRCGCATCSRATSGTLQRLGRGQPEGGLRRRHDPARHDDHRRRRRTRATRATAQFSFGSNDGGATFECRLDGAAYGPCGAHGDVQRAGARGAHVSARAIDGSDNEDATPATYTWTVDRRRAARAAGGELRASPRGGAAGGRAGRAASGCWPRARRAAAQRAKLSVSARTARRLGLGRRAAMLGSAAKRRRSAGTATVVVRLSRRARAALRGRAVDHGDAARDAERGQREAGGRARRDAAALGRAARVASRGLRLWVACARRCPLERRADAVGQGGAPAGHQARGARALRAGQRPHHRDADAEGAGAEGAPQRPQDGRTRPAEWARCSRPWRAPRPTRSARPSSARRCAANVGRASVVGVAQQVELLVVVQAVAGSSPVAHPH